MTLTLDFQGLIFNSHILGKRKVSWLGMKQIWVGYNVEHTVGLLLGHSAWQTDRPSNASMWNSYSFHPFCPGMGYSFTDLGAVLSFSERLVLLPYGRRGAELAAPNSPGVFTNPGTRRQALDYP